MEARAKKVAIGAGEDVTALVYSAAHRGGQAAPPVVLAHGAGAGQTHPFMVAVAEGLAARGVEVVTFNFLFTEIGKKSPDREPTLEACFRAVVAATTRGAAVLGGKSLGGRVASHLAAKGDAMRGLLLLSYPLKPPGKSELRTAHFPDVRVPCLFLQGTRDPFGTPADLAAHTGAIPGGAQIVAVDGGDHSWEVPKRLGMTEAEVMARALDNAAAWLRALPG